MAKDEIELKSFIKPLVFLLSATKAVKMQKKGGMG